MRGGAEGRIHAARGGTALGRRQAVRQRILIPPCGGSNPPAPTTARSDDFRRRCRMILPRRSGHGSAVSAYRIGDDPIQPDKVTAAKRCDSCRPSPGDVMTGTVRVWQGRPLDDWFSPADWSPQGVPQPGDQAVIDTSQGGPSIGPTDPVADGVSVALGAVGFGSSNGLNVLGDTLGSGVQITVSDAATYGALNLDTTTGGRGEHLRWHGTRQQRQLDGQLRRHSGRHRHVRDRTRGHRRVRGRRGQHRHDPLPR